MSWVALDDLVDQLLNVVEDDNLSGPINAVAPAPLSNLDFTRALGRTLKRPTLVPVPPAPLRLLLGGMAEETILADLSVLPKILTESGYAWRLPTIDACLRHELGV
jgi:NAD dependent epimerase/dehydratase family enzyme